MSGVRAREVEARGSTAGKIPSSAMERSSTMVASRCANVVAGGGSLRNGGGQQLWVGYNAGPSNVLKIDGMGQVGGAEGIVILMGGGPDQEPALRACLRKYGAG